MNEISAAAAPPSPGEAAKALLLECIEHNLGPDVLEAVADDTVTEIMLNPDGALWIEKFGRAATRVGAVEPDHTEVAIILIAGYHDQLPTAEKPIVEGELPLDGSRFQGLLPPIVLGPSYTIRKRPAVVFTLDDYVRAGNLSLEAKNILEDAVVGHKNILIVGGTGSGKTTFINAVVEAIARLTPDDRLAVIEDTRELQVTSANKVEMRTTDFTDMKDLLKATMRYNPDRILVGEVRDLHALTVIKSWNTGHDGGLATVHANSAEEGLIRIEQLIAEGDTDPNKAVLAGAIHYLVFMKKEEGFRRVKEIVEVGYSSETKDYVFDHKYCLGSRPQPVEDEEGRLFS